MIRVLIIEDEAAAARHLQKLLNAELEHFTFSATLTSVEKAVAWLRQHPTPDLIFMDIRLSDGLAFDILERCVITCPIIFTTAYDEYALRAFRTSGIDYLLKPISAEELRVGLTKFRTLTPAHLPDWLSRNLDTLAQFQPPGPAKARFLLKKGKQLFPALTTEIACFHRDELVFATLFNNQRFLIDRSLQQLQAQLPAQLFFRLNRSYLVQLNAIQNIHTGKPGQLTVTLSVAGHPPVELSQKRSQLLREILDA